MKLRPLAAGALLAALPGLALAQQHLPAPVEQQQLRELDAWSVGAISQGAMARDVWAQTDGAFLAALLDRLPATYESPAMQTLARRVLLSSADAPRGEAEVSARKRYEALGRMGAADELAQMAAGAATSDAAILQYAAQAELARGRRAEACARGRAAQGDPPAPFVLRLRAYCAAAGGDRAAADLALEIARQHGGEDAWYTGAVAAAGGAPGTRPPAARYDNSLSAQLSLAAHLQPGPNPLANASTLALAALARADTAPQPVRAQAAALAFRRGALSGADTRTILTATPAEITSGLPPIAVALRQVSAAPGSPAAASAIAGVLRTATSAADFSAASRFFKDDIAAILAAEAGPVAAPASAPDPNTALLFARAGVATGDGAFAARLIERARRVEAPDAGLAPLDAALAVMQNVRGNDALMAVRRRIDAGGARGARAAARDVAILTALGYPSDGAVQSFVLANAPQGGARADGGAMTALANAADRRAAGEAALLAIVAAGDGPAALDADSLASTLRALRAAGLDGDARRIAVEALLAGAPGA